MHNSVLTVQFTALRSSVFVKVNDVTHIHDSTAWSVFTFVTWIHLTFCQICVQFDEEAKGWGARQVERELEFIRTVAWSLSWSELMVNFELIRTAAWNLSWSELLVKLDWVKPTRGGWGQLEQIDHPPVYQQALPTSPFAAPTNCPLQDHFARWDVIFVKFNLWEFSPLEVEIEGGERGP